jgi:hypothetical protein
MAGKKRAKSAPALSALAAHILSRWGAAREELPLERLESELDDRRRYDIVAALKELEKAKLGELSVGRKGHKSHFAWARGAARAQKSRVAAAPLGPAEDPESSAPTSRSNQIRTTATARRASAEAAARKPPPVLEHAFHVRPHVMATFSLPADVTREEIERLCQLLQAIPFR